MGRLEDKFAAVDKKQAGLERELAALTDTKRLTERQRALEEDYKREHAKTGQRQGESEGREKEAVHAPGMSLADRAAAKEAENRLNELVEHSREHSRDKDRERRR
jgi:hypothetical protein